MSPLRRLAILLSSLSLLLAALVLAPAQSVDASQPSDYSLGFSTSLDRSGAQLLDGGVVPADQDIAVFLEAPSDAAIDWVAFFVDGHFEKLEFDAPYDLAGTFSDGTAAGRSFGTGSYHIEAWYQAGGSVGQVYASFTADASSPPPVACSTIAEIATSDPQFSTLVGALGAASDAGTIDFLGAVSNPDADLTVFAPTNAAFAALDPAILNAALADPAGLLTDVLAYHVLGSSETGEELIAAGTATTLLGEDVTITYDPLYDRVLINDSVVVVPNVAACNGIVHVIDAVLLPPGPAPVCSNIAEIATGDPQFSTLVDALSAASNAGTIDFLGAVSNNDADLTVFAPTNAAFAALDPAVLNAALADPAGLLTDVLAYHVLGSSQDGAALVNAGSATTLLGADVAVTTDSSGNVVINDSLVILPDIDACNGIVHVIDAVLLPPAPEPPAPVCSTIAEIATADGAPFTTLVTALDAATNAGTIDFLGAVSNPDAELTVFAPTDAAFAALDPDVLNAALADPAGLLTDVLAYHVLGSAQDGAALASAGSATTLLGANVTVTTSGADLFINESLVVQGNVEACNGIVHVIDAVLLPPAPEPPAPVCSTIAEIATADGAPFTTLVTALDAATNAGTIDFLGAVSNPDAELTVFAPTDAAFAALDPDVLNAALADPAGLLTDVLAYHVLGSAQDGAALASAGSATTLLGADVTVTTSGADLFINDSLVVQGNVEACNGIVHVIDAVLLPPAPPAPEVISDGNVIVLRNVDRNGFLDADPRRTGYNVDLSASVSADDEWILEAVGDGTWRLLNSVYGRYLDADSRRKHYNVDLNRNPNGYGVEWEIIPQGDGLFALRSVDVNRFLDADRNNVDTSSRISHDDIWEITPAS